MYLSLDKETKILNMYNTINVKFKTKDTFALISTNESGLEIFTLCDGTRTQEEIVEALESQYDLNEESINYIKSFINYHISVGLIKEGYEKQFCSIRLFGDSKLIIPEQLTIEMTNKCNLSCKHCLNNSNFNSNSYLDTNEIINLLKRFNDLGTANLMLTGGEPTVHEGIDRILHELTENDFETIVFASNCYEIENYIDAIKNVPNMIVQTSIDGIKETHSKFRGKVDAFEKTLSNIEKLIANNVQVNVCYTINDYNLNQLEETMILCKDIGVRSFKVGMISKLGRAKTNNLGNYDRQKCIDLVKELSKKHETENFKINNGVSIRDIEAITQNCEYPNKCGAGYRELHIRPNGDVLMCGSIMGLTFGNIKSSKLDQILLPENLEKTKNIPSPCEEVCGDCKELPFCKNCISKAFEHDKKDCRLIREINM